MAIGKLSNKVSGDDIARVKDIRNPPEHEPGFGPDSGGDFADIFGDSEMSFDDLISSDFGSPTSSGATNAGSTTFGGGGNIFGGSDDIFGGGVFGQPTTPFGQPIGQTQPKEYKPDNFDKVLDASGTALLNIGKIILDVFKSIKNRNADDFAYYSRNLIITGASIGGSSLLLGIIGGISGVKFISFRGLTGQLLGCGMLTIGTGLIGIGFAAIRVATMGSVELATISQLPDIADVESNDSTDDYEDNVGEILDDLFGDDNELFELDDITPDKEEETFKPSFDDISYTAEELNYDKKLEEVRENQYITRETLFNTFREFFPTNTPNFADKNELSPDSEDFQTIETICLKALANVAKCEMEDVKSHLESATESYFSYELRMKRIKGVTKIDDIAREMEAYFRESSTDTSVSATVDIEGDFYKIIVTKGVTAVVTFGDIFKQKYACEFFLNAKNKLPFIMGISELGEVLLEDAKIYDTMLIAGKPRSGKSWFVLSILMAIMMFNSPEEVQFIIVDPKESNLFNTMALMPHVCGHHNDSKILDVMRDIIDNEGARRKKLLADNKCDDIWALWKKGIKLPILYLVIDEVITIKNNLGPLDKEFDTLMQTMISQLPSQGIRLLFVPHRATGVVNRTNRTMLQFTAAVKSDIEDVNDTLGIKNWKRSLVNQGDIAIKVSNRQNPLYARGGAITTSDEDNTELIVNAARAFYKMGIDIPDMSSMITAVNRDEDYIREELSTGNKRMQYNAATIFNDLN